jgi:hypothetical protein
MPRKQQGEVVQERIAALKDTDIAKMAKAITGQYVTFLDKVKNDHEDAPFLIAALIEGVRAELTATLLPVAVAVPVARLRKNKRKAMAVASEMATSGYIAAVTPSLTWPEPESEALPFNHDDIERISAAAATMGSNVSHFDDSVTEERL